MSGETNYHFVEWQVDGVRQPDATSPAANPVPGISMDRVRPTLVAALDALQQKPPAKLSTCSVPEIWDWALRNWHFDALRGKTAIIHESP